MKLTPAQSLLILRAHRLRHMPEARSLGRFVAGRRQEATWWEVKAVQEWWEDKR